MFAFIELSLQIGTCTANSLQKMLQETSGMTEQYVNIGLEKRSITKNSSNVMALLVDLRETGEKSASAKINSRSLRTQSAAEEPSFVPA